MSDPQQRHPPTQGASAEEARDSGLTGARRRRFGCAFIAAALAGTIFLLSSRSFDESDSSGLRLPRGPLGNAAHIVAFGSLAFFVVRALDTHAAGPGLGVRTGRVALAAVAAFGLSDEIHQFFTPGRTCGVYDVLLDTLGAVVVLTFPWPAGRGRPRRPWISIAVFGVALIVADLTSKSRPFPDRVLQTLLEACTGLQKS